MLTRDDILRGSKKTKTITIKELGGDIEIRPLNEGQWAEIDAKKVEMFKIDIEPVMKQVDGQKVYDNEKTRDNIKITSDLSKSKNIEFETNLLICKYGMILEFTIDELKQISPPGVIKKIADEILKLSQINEEELQELKSFRKQ
jgi:hypothetical protein